MKIRQWIRRLRPRERSARTTGVLTVCLLVCAICGIHLLCQMIGTLDFSRGRFSSYFHEPTIFLLNFLPVALLIVFFYFLTNRAWLAYLLPSVLLVVMEFVNYFLVTLRGDPLTAEDLLLLNEAAGTVGSYELDFPIWFFVSIALLLGGAIVLLRYARGRIPKRLWWVRVLGGVCCIAVAAGSWLCWYTDAGLYDRQENTSLFNVWNEPENYASHGFFWSFLRSVDEAFPPAPDGYSEETAQELLAPYTDAPIAENQRVNIVVTMLESYADLSEFDTIRFTKDPYAEWHALQEEAYHGTLLCDVIGGGTVNSERSFLTGFLYPHPRYHGDSFSFVRYFKENGYRTVGAHPGYAWFYSRSVINKRLGFDEYLFTEDHFSKLTSDDHASDAVFFPEMTALYEKWLAEDDSPFFSFSLSYQNHSPYDDTALLGEEYVSHEGLEDAAYYRVNNYLSGIADTNRHLAAYVDSFRERKEPVVLVFFGDHKPTLGVGNRDYAQMGIAIGENNPEGCENLYTTPYLIWANDAAKELFDCDFTGEGRTLSHAFLMAELFDLCGWQGPAWMQYQRSFRDVISGIHCRSMFLTDGELSNTLPAHKQALWHDFQIVEYYMRDQLYHYDSIQ